MEKNKSDFTPAQQEILANIEEAYKRWRTGNPSADTEEAFRIGYLNGQATGLGEALSFTRGK